MTTQQRLVDLSQLAFDCRHLAPQIDALADMLIETLRAGGKILVCGNGGSAAQSAHFVAELQGRFRRHRKPLGAIDLTSCTAALTVIANDFDFADVFFRQVISLGKPGDALLCLTTSGCSENVVSAAAAATADGLRVVAITGANGFAGDTVVAIPSSDTALVQELTLSVIHSICERIDAEEW